MTRFGKTQVPIKLTGEEWFTILARLQGLLLSPQGSRVYREAAKKMATQIGAASDAHGRRKEPAHETR